MLTTYIITVNATIRNNPSNTKYKKLERRVKVKAETPLKAIYKYLLDYHNFKTDFVESNDSESYITSFYCNGNAKYYNKFKFKVVMVISVALPFTKGN